LRGARLIDVFPAIPVGVLLIGDGDDLADGEGEVVVVARRIVIQGLDLERHDDAARGQQRSQSAAVDARWKLWRGSESSSFQAKCRRTQGRVLLKQRRGSQGTGR
jgi:hypothetical protein